MSGHKSKYNLCIRVMNKNVIETKVIYHRIDVSWTLS
jgi:hypothetical protein